jgi:hypothetical protein
MEKKMLSLLFTLCIQIILSLRNLGSAFATATLLLGGRDLLLLLLDGGIIGIIVQLSLGR